MKLKLSWQKMDNDCIYFCYCDYCDKFTAQETQLYGYSDLTEHKCEYKGCQAKCKNYTGRLKNEKSN